MFDARAIRVLLTLALVAAGIAGAAALTEMSTGGEIAPARSMASIEAELAVAYAYAADCRALPVTPPRCVP